MYTLRNLRCNELEYENVAMSFNRSASGKGFHLEIQSIQRITNWDLFKKFQRKEQEYREKYGQVRIHLLFHGTKKANIPSILEKNLEVARHGQNIGHRFGNGVSFSALSNYSSHYCDRSEDEKQMLLCSVLISNIIEVPESRGGHPNSQPPFIEGRWPPLRYDTTAKSRVKMDVIVKYEDHTFYPEYIIHFKKILHLQFESMIEVDGIYPQMSDEELLTGDEILCDLSEHIQFSPSAPAEDQRSSHFSQHRLCAWLAIFIFILVLVLWIKVGI